MVQDRVDRPSRGPCFQAAAFVLAALIFSMACRDKDFKPFTAAPEDPDPPGIPELTALPYETAGDVWVSARYTPEHEGIDLSARKDIPIRAMGRGVFKKKLYFHPGVPRWQVNADILVGEYAIACLFESGDSVTQAQAQTQFDMLPADGTPVKAGDLLGNLYLAPGQEHSMFHFGVYKTTTATGQAECPMPYCSQEVRDALLALYRRDNPGGQICHDHTY